MTNRSRTRVPAGSNGSLPTAGAPPVAARSPRTMTLSTGFVLPYQEITPALAAKIAFARTEPPQPPTREIEAVEGLRTVPNEQDPEYIRAYGLWQFNELQHKAMTYLKYGGQYELTDQDNELLDEYIGDLADLGEPPDIWTPRNRMATYILVFCVQNLEDYIQIIAGISGTPTTEEVDTVKATFQRDVQRT